MDSSVATTDGQAAFERAIGERDPGRILVGLRRRWWVIALIGLIAAFGAYYLAKGKPKEYQASASLLFTNSHLDQQLLGSQIVDTTDPTRAAATNQGLVALPTVSQLVAAQLHIPVSTVSSDVSIGSDQTSDLLSVSATDTHPGLAAAIANTYVRQYIAFRQQADRSQLAQAESLVKNALAKIPPSKQESSAAQNLQAKSLQLKLLASLQSGDAEVVQTAKVPHSPVSPKPSRDGLIGLVLGLVVGGALVFLLERRDRRIKLSGEVEELYGIPVIGHVPESGSLRATGAIGAPRDREAFSMIRAQLRYFDIDRDIKRVMVSSADTGEGKSMVSLNLTRAAAHTNDKRVLLIETDLRRPSLSHMIGMSNVAGLTELLGHSQDLETGLRELVVTPEAPDGAPAAFFDVLLAGGTPPNPAELLQSHRMTELLEYAESAYDLVVLDTPPIGVISDAIPLVHQVDGVLVVSRLGYSRRDRAARLMKQLRGLDAHLLGVVINGSQEAARGYYGYYAAPYGGREGGRNGVRERARTRPRS